MIEETLSLDLSGKLLNHILLPQILLWKDLYSTNKTTLLLSSQNHTAVSTISQLFYDLEPLNTQFHPWSRYALHLKGSRYSKERRRFFGSWVIWIFSLFLQKFLFLLHLNCHRWSCVCLLLKRSLLHTEFVILIPLPLIFLDSLLSKAVILLRRSHGHPSRFLILLSKII